MHVMTNSQKSLYISLFFLHFAFIDTPTFTSPLILCTNRILEIVFLQQIFFKNKLCLISSFNLMCSSAEPKATGNMSLSYRLCLYLMCLNLMLAGGQGGLNVCLCVCDCGGGRWATELEEAPHLSEQSPSTSWNMEHMGFCYHRVTVKGGEEVFFLSLQNKKLTPCRVSLRGFHSSSHLPLPPRPLGEAQSSPPPLLASSLVSFHRSYLPPNLSHLVSSPSLRGSS